MKKWLVPWILVIIGLGIAVRLASGRKPPAKKAPPPVSPLVEVMEVKEESLVVPVEATGTVEAVTVVNLVPQVGGTILEVHPSFRVGGVFQPDEALIQIDPGDYQTAVKQAEALVAKSEVALQQIKREADIAKEAWRWEHPEAEPPSPLVFKEPQLKEAEANLQAAKASLEKARRDLERTQLRLPFQGSFLEIYTGIGGMATPGQPLAKVYDIQDLEVVVPLEARALRWFSIPGAKADIQAFLQGKTHTWRGKVARMEGAVDPRTQMVKIRIKIISPYAEDKSSIRLLPGTFVKVHIHGKKLKGVFRLPEYVLHENNTLWIYQDGTIDIRPVEVIHAIGEEILVRQGLKAKEQVITSPLEVVTQGMAVRVSP